MQSAQKHTFINAKNLQGSKFFRTFKYFLAQHSLKQLIFSLLLCCGLFSFAQEENTTTFYVNPNTTIVGLDNLNQSTKFAKLEKEGLVSYGKGTLWYFTYPALKAGMTYHIDGRNRISYNMLGEYRAPLVNNVYFSPRIRDKRLEDPCTQEKVIAYDIAYEFIYPMFKGRIAAFQTHVYDAMQNMGYYDDENFPPLFC